MKHRKNAPLPLEEVQGKQAKAERKMTAAQRRRVPQEQKKQDVIRRLCSGEYKGKAPETAQKNRGAHLMARAFSDKYRKYQRREHPYDWSRKLQQNPGTLGCFSRASVQADMIGCSYEDYVEAQFYWFDDWYSRTPRHAELASAGAIVRCRSWKTLQETGEAPKHTLHPAAIKVEVCATDSLPQVVLDYEEQVLQRMVRQWGSEEEVWRLFGASSDEEVFSDAFKRTRASWREMYDGGS